MADRKILTTESGAPVADNQHSQTAGPNGPVLMQDHHLIEKLARFERERIPERVVHAKGSGAFGTFEVTKDVSRYTKARFLCESRQAHGSPPALLDGGGREGFCRHRA